MVSQTYVGSHRGVQARHAPFPAVVGITGGGEPVVGGEGDVLEPEGAEERDAPAHREAELSKGSGGPHTLVLITGQGAR